MTMLRTMYSGAVNSKATSIVGALDITTTTIQVLDGDTLPDAPNLLVLGGDSTSETVLMTEKIGNTLTIERAVQGMARSWQAGTLIARNFTEKDYATLIENINILNTEKIEKQTGKGLSTNDYTDLDKEQVGTISALKQDIDSKVSSVNTKTGKVTIDVEDIAGLNASKIAIGRDAIASAGSRIAIGHSASANAAEALALGSNASVGGVYAVALGSNAICLNSYEGVMGVSVGSGARKWIVPGSFTVEGTKNFEIPHPKPSKSETHRIRHSAVESPNAGDTLYRYKIISTKQDDMQIISLPDYFIHLNKNVQIFVTPQGHYGSGYGILNSQSEQLEIYCQDKGEYNVLAIGTRNDSHQSVQDWDIKGVEREIGESWNGETYAFEDDEILSEDEYLEEII